MVVRGENTEEDEGVGVEERMDEEFVGGAGDRKTEKKDSRKSKKKDSYPESFVTNSNHNFFTV